MARKTSTPPPKPPDAELKVTRDEARQKIEERIKEGEQLVNRQVGQVGFDEYAERIQRWGTYNIALLNSLFTTDQYSKEYTSSGSIRAIPFNASAYELLESRLQTVRSKVVKLKTIIDRLPLIPEPNGRPQSLRPSTAELNHNVFIVHGSNLGRANEVARLLGKLSIDHVILHEQPNGGKTLIEKFELHAGDVGFAIVLLTADDEGRLRGSSDLKPRARQNVVFEQGFFSGKLGRERVCVLYEEGVELPSDLHGIVYVKLSDDWQVRVARELRASGFAVDMNLLF